MLKFVALRVFSLKALTTLTGRLVVLLLKKCRETVFERLILVSPSKALR